MAVSLTSVINNRGQRVATWEDTAGGGTPAGAYLADFPDKTVQRISGTGTYTVEGSNDGETWGDVGTLVAVNDNVPHLIEENPAYLRVEVAAAAATVIIVGSK